MSIPSVDLHFHSNFSDGKLSVAEIADHLKKNDLKICALTDHNSVAGVQELKQRVEGNGTIVISGTELTAKFGENEVHILAYDFDIQKAASILQERNDIVDNQKRHEMENAIHLTREQDFEITEGLLPHPSQPVTLTIALDICSKKSNQDICARRHSKVFIPEDFFYEYQAPGRPCFVERSGVTVEWLVKKFKRVAHDLVIAHPFLSVSVVTHPLDEEDIYRLLKTGVNGIEVYHDHTSSDQISFLKRIVEKERISYTGGSDSHGRPKDTAMGHYGHNNFIPDFCLTRYRFPF